MEQPRSGCRLSAKMGFRTITITGEDGLIGLFGVNNSELGNTERTEGLKRITAFWAEKNGISLEDAVFQLKIKKTALPPRSWEYDFLHKQMAKPWIDAGTVEWKSRQFMANIPAIKTL